MTPFIAELVGTATLVLLGNGVVANVVLNRYQGTKQRMDRNHYRLGPGSLCRRSNRHTV